MSWSPITSLQETRHCTLDAASILYLRGRGETEPMLALRRKALDRTKRDRLITWGAPETKATEAAARLTWREILALPAVTALQKARS